MKHAFLIMTHGNLPMLQYLVRCLDDSRNDIFVHIDSKAPFDGSELVTTESKLMFVTDRIDAAWGDYSLVEIEMSLFRIAFDNGPYEYYHLMSGTDILIKSQNYIHEFCKENNGKEFIAFSRISEKDLKWRFNHRFVFTRHFREERLMYRLIRGAHLRLQDLFCPKQENIEVKKGSQWCSVTNDFVLYLLSRGHEIKRLFDRTFAPDEMVMQTLSWNSPFKDRIYDSRESACGNMRYIRWKDREPQEIRFEWAYDMIDSQHWFARKCNDPSVAEKIERFVKENL